MRIMTTINLCLKKNSDLDDISKLNLYFAIGKAMEDIKKYSESYDYIKKANDIKNNLINYNFSQDEQISENSKKLLKILEKY